MNRALPCHMIDACSVAYWIGKPGGIEASPRYAAMGFHARPTVIVAGNDDIDACFVGTTDAGVVVGFRGTVPLTFESPEAFWQSLLDLLNDADLRLCDLEGVPGRVQRGMARSVLALWDPLVEAIDAATRPGQALYLAGHSKGGSLAALAALRLLEMRGQGPTAVFPIANLKVGDADFVSAYDERLPQSYRYAYQNDIVPHLPLAPELAERLGDLLGDADLQRWDRYEHTKTLQFINWNDAIIDFGDLTPGEAQAIQDERTKRLVELLLTLQIAKIAGDHSCDDAYTPAMCASP